MRHGVFCARNVSSSARWEGKQMDSHMQSAKHKASTSSCQQMPGISQFCSALVSTVPPPPSPISTTGTAATNIRTMLGCTPRMKAELLDLCVWLISYHHNLLGLYAIYSSVLRHSPAMINQCNHKKMRELTSLPRKIHIN